MKKVLVLLAEGFEEIEAVTPVIILRRAEVDVTIAGIDVIEVKGARGVVYKADILLKDAPVDSFDAVVLPGGMPGAENLAASSAVNDLLLHMNKNGKLIAAICAAPAVILAPLGLLDGRTATCYPGCQDGFSEKTVYSEENAVIDDNIITSRGAGTAVDFSLAVLEYLTDRKTAQGIGWTICYGR